MMAQETCFGAAPRAWSGRISDGNDLALIGTDSEIEPLASITFLRDDRLGEALTLTRETLSRLN
jgi:hypothetical protein